MSSSELLATSAQQVHSIDRVPLSKTAPQQTPARNKRRIATTFLRCECSRESGNDRRATRCSRSRETLFTFPWNTQADLPVYFSARNASVTQRADVMNCQATLPHSLEWARSTSAPCAARGALSSRLPAIAKGNVGDDRTGNGTRWKRFLVARTAVLGIEAAAAGVVHGRGIDHD